MVMTANLTPADYAKIPLADAPDGAKPLSSNPESCGPMVIGVSSMLVALSSILVLNRIFVKTVIKRPSWDDLTLLLAFLGSLGYYGALVWGVNHGPLGLHAWDVSILDASSKDFLIPAYIWSVLPQPSMLFLKATFFLLYLQLFHQFRWIRIASLVCLGVMSAFYAATTILLFKLATPAPGTTWVENTTSADATTSAKLAVPLSSVNFALDVVVLCLPVAGVAGLKMDFLKKLGASVIFFSGLGACVCSILCIHYRIVMKNDTDTTWILASVATATLAELLVGIICACIPQAISTYRHLRWRAGSALSYPRRPAPSSSDPSDPAALDPSRSRSSKGSRRRPRVFPGESLLQPTLCDADPHIHLKDYATEVRAVPLTPPTLGDDDDDDDDGCSDRRTDTSAGDAESQREMIRVETLPPPPLPSYLGPRSREGERDLERNC